MNPYTDHPDHPDHAGTDLEEPGLSALYRQGATQTPRSDLDRRILDQAQAALRSGPANVRQSGPRPWRWLWSKCQNGLPRWSWSRSGIWNWRQVAIPLSSAAGLLLAVGLVLRVLEEQSAVQGISGMAPRSLAEDQLSQPPRPSTSTQPHQPTQPIKQSQSTQQSHSISPSKPEREVAAKSAWEEASTLGAVARLSPPAPAPTPASVPAHDNKAPVDERLQADPERWLEDIRQRWSSGQRAEAIRQLTAFRQVHPRYPVPTDLAPLMEAQ